MNKKILLTVFLGLWAFLIPCAQAMKFTETQIRHMAAQARSEGPSGTTGLLNSIPGTVRATLKFVVRAGSDDEAYDILRRLIIKAGHTITAAPAPAPPAPAPAPAPNLGERATKIQSFFRGWRARRQATQLRAEKARQEQAATKLQARLRGWRARRQATQLRADALRQKNAAKRIQRGWRARAHPAPNPDPEPPLPPPPPPAPDPDPDPGPLPPSPEEQAGNQTPSGTQRMESQKTSHTT